METNDQENGNEPLKNQINDDAQFENSDVDPGFLGHQDEDKALKGREDKREHNIDASMSIKEMREAKEKEDQEGDTEEGKQDDALNYGNDREHGSYNPKNI